MGFATAAKNTMLDALTMDRVRLHSGEAVTEADATDLDSATGFDSVNTTTETVPGTAGYLGICDVTLTNKDSVAAGDMVRFLVRRDSDAAGDDAAASAYLIALEIQEA